MHRIALRFDDVFHAAYRETEVKRPLFIIGLPRSGTTLVHRVIASQESTFTTLPLWELVLAPAICQKRMVHALREVDGWFGSPMSRLVDRIERRLLERYDSLHTTTLTSAEEDYLGLLPYQGCFLAVVANPFDDRVWNLSNFHSELAEDEKRRLLKAYRGILQRHLYFRGTDRTVVSKNPSFTSWIPDLAQTFPDARFLGIRRDPLQSVPSQLSSLRGPMQVFGNDVTDPEIVDRIVRMMANYWTALQEAAATLPRDRYHVLEYQDLISETFQRVSHTMQVFGYSRSAADARAVRDLCERQREYRSTHHYRLEDFGLTPERLSEVFGALEKVPDAHRKKHIEAKLAS